MKDQLVNRQISGESVFLVPDGIVSKFFALSKAQDEGLDLVQVSIQDNNIPVCKILDYGKLKYEQKKSDKKNKPIVQKEIRFRIVTQEHDYLRVVKRITEWVEHGHPVKASIILKGREKNFQNDAREKLKDICNRVENIAECSKQESTGGIFSVLLNPRKKHG